MTREFNLPSSQLLTTDRISRYHVPKSPMKRIIDYIFILFTFPLILLCFIVISTLIVMDSRGGVLYHGIRIGKGGRRFKVYKFRTMIQNAELILEEWLEKSPELKAEWLATHKLKNDPRITRVGKVLRKLSLDELPQFWNILIGDMSLIGPRPIVDDEIEKYGKCYELYKQARPGITGLWQVSGRSDTTYKQRVELDEYYLLNRSFILDIKIIIKTIFVVLGRKGAY